MKENYDVIIVGGGMVGASLAVALGQQADLTIALIEAYQTPVLQQDDPTDLRVSALTRASEEWLKSLAIWQHLIPARLSAFTDMKVWETANSQLHFDSAEIAAPYLGHIVENRHLQQASLMACSIANNIDVICPEKPLSRDDNTLTLDNGRLLTAKLIIAADGAQSPLREWANIKVHGWDYQQTAIVCTATTEKPHQQTAWQHFLSEGPLAFLPLAQKNQCSIVWSNSSEEAELLTQLDDEDFKLTLAKALDHKLGEITAISQRASFPLKLRHADHYIETGFALVGDAAHTIHPLAGQGVNIGLLDAKALADIVLEAHNRGRDIGSLHTLKKYQRRRKADNIAMQLTMDIFKRSFGSDLAPLRWARRFGLRTVNKHTVLQKLFMHQAAGYR